LIAIGDPHQNPPVGAGGLWPHLEAATRDEHSQAVLTRNLRAHDHADRRDQARFRDGDHELAVRGHAARRRVHIGADLTRAEDAALDAAHSDTQNRRTTVVLAQTSNDHLDELNARYQAIRRQRGELGTDMIAAPRRPYTLHPGDQVQIRRTISHPDHGPLRNGTTAVIGDIDADAQTIELLLSTGQPVDLNIDQADAAQLRLAYVQHPFPAQGTTTDTAHLIVSAHATREGTYVALTRAREQTHLYAEESVDSGRTGDRLQALADRISRRSPTFRRSPYRSSTSRQSPRRPCAANRAPTSAGRSRGRLTTIIQEPASAPPPTMRPRLTVRTMPIETRAADDGHVSPGSNRAATSASSSATTPRPPVHQAGNRDECDGARERVRGDRRPLMNQELLHRH
jgi:hypothetical protein